jgi:hypothetical protein
MDATAEALHTDFERGAADGRTRRRHNQPIPLLDGGAYAVGFLFGYHEEQRRPTPHLDGGVTSSA